MFLHSVTLNGNCLIWYWNHSYSNCWEELEGNYWVVTRQRIFDLAIEAGSDEPLAASIDSYFERNWDDGTGLLDAEIVRRDRNDLVTLTQRLLSWADATTAGTSRWRRCVMSGR